jgi:hypothetical protein
MNNLAISLFCPNINSIIGVRIIVTCSGFRD